MNSKENIRNHHQSTSGASNPKRVNLDYLNDLSGGDTDFIIEVIDMFLDVAPDSVKQLLTYEKNGSYGQVKSTVHKLKPTLQMLGDMELHALAVVIEEASLNNGPETDTARTLLRENLVTFVKDSQLLIKELQQVVADMRAGK